jgi:hypothetical protein
MCNLYSQTRNVEAIRRLFRVPHNRAPVVVPQPAIDNLGTIDVRDPDVAVAIDPGRASSARLRVRSILIGVGLSRWMVV